MAHSNKTRSELVAELEKLQARVVKLEESEKKCRTLMETTNDAIFVADADSGVILEANKRAGEMMGLPPEEIVGMHQTEIHPKDKAKEYTKRFQDYAKAGGGILDCEAHVYHRSGKLIPIEISGSVIKSGNKTLIQGIFHDLTERRKMESGLRYQMILEDIPVLICRFLPNGEITYVNKAYCKYFAKTFEELVGSPFFLLIPEENRETVMAGISALTVRAPMQSHEHKVIARGGEISWQRWTNQALFDARGNVVVYQSIGEDITERKRAEDALRESEKKYRSLVDITSDSVYELDENLRYTYVSRCGGDMARRKSEDLVGKTPFDFMPEEEKERVSEFIQSKLDPPQSISGFENILIGQDGRPIVVETSAVPIYDMQGQFSGYLCVDRDITRRKRVELQLRRQEEHLKSILETSQDGIAVTSADHEVVYGNTALASMYGYEEVADLIGTQTDGYFAPESYPVLGQMREKLNRGEPIDDIIGFKGMRQDGSVFDAELCLGSFFEEGRRLDVGVIRDVSDRKRMEFQLNQSSKLAAIGELAAGVAHEMNNPLAAIDIQAGLMHDILEEEGKEMEPAIRAELEESCQLVEEQVRRCQSVTANLLSFFRMPMIELETFQIGDLLRRTVSLVAGLAEKKVNIEIILEDHVPAFKGDPNRLLQVFVNMLTNAIKATGENGLITIETKMDDEGRIVIEFRDSGVGIDPEIKDRIFDPFFTTGAEGEGSGLGLSISYYIIKQMKGDIQVESVPGSGSIFRIMLSPTAKDH